jgi:gamma-glutamylcyclotransferase (GGCT)/AIG2-like uncharacterized protein YtfP
MQRAQRVTTTRPELTAPLFIYGTLHPNLAPPEIASTVALLQPLGKATLRGRLYRFAGYPGLVLDEAGDETIPIPGELFGLPDGVEADAIRARLDAYEGFNSENLAASLFRRVPCQVTLPDGTLAAAQVYVYNQPVI